MFLSSVSNFEYYRNEMKQKSEFLIIFFKLEFIQVTYNI